MNNLTLLVTIFIIYVIVVNVLGAIHVFTTQYADKKVSDTTLGILLVVAIPISLPIVLCLQIFDKWKRRKRKQDLEKQFDDFIKENENDR